MEQKLQDIIHSTILNPEKADLMKVLESVSHLIETRWSTIVDFVKQYSGHTEQYKSALLLCKVLSEKYFEKLEKDLTPGEKSRIQELMKKSGEVKPDIKNLQDMEIKIKKTMIGQSVSNVQLRQLVTSMNHGDIMSFCTKFPTQASLLIQLLDNHQLSELYNNLSKEKLMSLTQMALGMELTSKSEGELLETLKNYQQQSPKSLISGHLGSILSQLPPSKENVIIDDLIVNGKVDQLTQITKSFFPSRLIMKVKDSVLKEFCQVVSTQEKAEFLIAVSDSDKEFWQQTIAPEGSKIKEAIDLELSSMESNENLVNNIHRNSDNIQFKFYNSLRDFLANHYPKEMTEITAAWVADEVGE